MNKERQEPVKLHGYKDRRMVALGKTLITVDVNVEEHRNGNFDHWIERLNYRHNEVTVYQRQNSPEILIAVDYHGVTVGDASPGDRVFRVFSY
jgi:hypothetical protein